jgi:putative membrane protein
MTKYISKYLLLLIVGFGIAFTVQASENGDAQDASERFIKNVSMSSLFEIEAAEVVFDRSKNPEVIRIAERMIRDHKASSEELKNILIKEKLRFRFSMTLDEEHADKIRELKKASEDKFDKTYLTMQEDAHEDTIDEFERFLDAKDTHPELRKFAERNLPIIKQHHQKIDNAERMRAN